MSQTTALLHDAYRELNSKRMFWIVLVLSAIVVAAFALIGIDKGGNITLGGMRTGWPAIFTIDKMFKLIFQIVGIDMWLTRFAMILAVISTASIFPDFMTGGSIDLYLSKPIGRFRLFLTKYVAGMAFVALQVGVFSAACFLVIGFRAKVWEPRLFLAVPLVVCVFSYLWSVSVLVGVLTRSTLAAALLTMIVWCVIWGADTADSILLLTQTSAENAVKLDSRKLPWLESQAIAQRNRVAAATQPSARDVAQLERMESQWHELESQKLADETSLGQLTRWHKGAYYLKTALPKTRETNELLSRSLLSRDDLTELDMNHRDADNVPDWAKVTNMAATNEIMRKRPVWWIVGTSLIFELVVVAVAARSFCRRDF